MESLSHLQTVKLMTTRARETLHTKDEEIQELLEIGFTPQEVIKYLLEQHVSLNT